MNLLNHQIEDCLLPSELQKGEEANVSLEVHLGTGRLAWLFFDAFRTVSPMWLTKFSSGWFLEPSRVRCL